MKKCVNPVPKHEGKNFVNILCVFMNVTGIIVMESMPLISESAVVFSAFSYCSHVGQNFKEFQGPDLLSRTVQAWKINSQYV